MQQCRMQLPQLWFGDDTPILYENLPAAAQMCRQPGADSKIPRTCGAELTFLSPHCDGSRGCSVRAENSGGIAQALLGCLCSQASRGEVRAAPFPVSFLSREGSAGEPSLSGDRHRQ